MFNQESDNFWNQINRLENLIRAVEVKAGILFSIHSFIIGAFINKLEIFNVFYQGNIILIFIVICWMLLVLFSVYYCLNCFLPRMELKYDDNVFFYKDAINRFETVKSFSKEITHVCTNNEVLYQQLSEQIHAESKIVNKKFLSFNSAFRYFSFSLIFAIIFLIYKNLPIS